MGKKKKIILAFSIVVLVVLLILSSLVGAILYTYHHPSKIKPLIEQAVSRTTGTRCTIQELRYSLEARTVGAKGIVLLPQDRGQGFHLEIPDLKAGVSLEGPFGQRVLIVNNLRVEALTLQFSKAFSLPEIKTERKFPDFLSRPLKALVALLLFKEVRFQTGEMENAHIFGQMGDREFELKGLRARVTEDRLLDISGSARVESPSEGLSLHAPFVRMTTDHALSITDLEIKGMLELKKGSVQTPKMDVENLTLSTPLTYKHDRKTMVFGPLDARLKGVTLKEVLGAGSPKLDLNLKADGVIELRPFKVRTDRFQLSVGDLLDLRGSLKGELAESPYLDLQGLEARLIPSKVLPFFPRQLKKLLAPITLSGPITVSGNMEGSKEAELWRFSGDLKVQLKENRFAFETPKGLLRTRLTGEIQMKGDIADPDISMKIRGEETTFSENGLALAPFEMNLSLAGRYPLFELKALSVHMPQARLKAGAREFLVRDIEAEALSGTIDVREKRVTLPGLEIHTSLLRNMSLSLRLGVKQGQLTLRGEEIGLIETGVALNLIPPHWKFKGADRVLAEADLKEGGEWAFSSTIALQDLSLENRDSSCIGEKIDVHAEIKAEGGLGRSRTAATASIRMDKGEVLYDRFYLDLGKTPFFSTGRGGYDTAGKSLELSDLALGWKDILTLHIRGMFHAQGKESRLHLFVKMPETPLAAPFRHFLLEPYKREKPFLNTLKIGGSISADLELKGHRTNWTVKGHSRWHGGAVSSPAGDFSLQGIDLDLPIWFQDSGSGVTSPIRSATPTTASRPDRPPDQEESLEGSFSVGSMRLPLLPEQPLSIPLRATLNGLSVATPTLLRVPGGEFEVGPIIGQDLLASAPSLLTSLTLKDLDLAPLLSRIWPRPIQGFAQGKLHRVSLENDRLRSVGEIRVQAFGGEILVSNLGLSGLFTSAPAFRLDARLRDLRMAELTKETSFGRIEGILEGGVKNLEIAYGQPQRFDLLLETVEREGVPQKISVRAVDNIAQIGGGQSPFIGMAGILTSFFKEFPYKKIGVHATLENDVFRINGTIKESGKEYIIKRGGFSGVNVVNQNPDNFISFKDMVKRIRRVTASKSGPVVK
ncbi:MAG: hypothetical protein KKE57_11865 [Proteobacteria bacterium]|nr:hypothetical protein [Pseudomonadota bacterium]